jgi:hypothetical protein
LSVVPDPVFSSFQVCIECYLRQWSAVDAEGLSYVGGEVSVFSDFGAWLMLAATASLEAAFLTG